MKASELIAKLATEISDNNDKEVFMQIEDCEENLSVDEVEYIYSTISIQKSAIIIRHTH